MAKKKKIVEEHKSEPVTNCDQSKEVVTNCDNQQFAVTIGDHKNIDIKSMIRVIRSQQVMLDFELAMLYGVETKALNQAVKRNINRFPDDFMFQLTKNELESLRSQIVTSNSTEKQQDTNWKSQIVTSNPSHNDGAKILMSQNATSNFAKMGLRRPPYAFTRNGIGMLSSVLRSETAVGVNILIMRAFTAIPQIVNQNVQMVQRIFNIEQHQMETDEKIELILDKIEEIAPKQLPEQIFQTGCVWDAWAFVSDLVRSAQQRIELIDNFVDDRVLSLLMKRGKGVSATIHSRFTKDFLTDLEKHNTQYEEVKFVQLPHKNHDRFLIIDDTVYLLGASVKDMGNGLCAVTKLQALPETILGMLK
ncbi:MAG: ORF6N domain-containing protein [Prevotella sp.]|nr:ORF6N domain-containing protein [Prevotella sp.]